MIIACQLCSQNTLGLITYLLQLIIGPCRLCKKLERLKAEGKTAEMEEEFRILTLQIIGEAFLSLPPEESDKVSSHHSHFQLKGSCQLKHVLRGVTIGTIWLANTVATCLSNLRCRMLY